MLLIAHRGFSEGEDENTLAALERAAADKRIGGVELDIRMAADGSDVVLRHDPFTGAAGEADALSLDEALAFAKPHGWEVLLECKEFDVALYKRVRELVARHAFADNVVLFGFKDVAARFPWSEARPFRFGVIEEYPWRIAGTVAAFRPDMLLMGWADTRTRLAVQAWWSAFSLRRLAATMPGTAIVMGVAQNESHVEWFRRHGVLHAATIDLR